MESRKNVETCKDTILTSIFLGMTISGSICSYSYDERMIHSTISTRVSSTMYLLISLFEEPLPSSFQSYR